MYRDGHACSTCPRAVDPGLRPNPAEFRRNVAWEELALRVLKYPLMRARRRLLAATTATLLTFTLVGCGPLEPSSHDAGSAAPEQPESQATCPTQTVQCAPAVTPPPPPEDPPPPPPPESPRKKLLKHGWDAIRPSWMRDHLAKMDTGPFDGVFLQLPSLSSEVMRISPVSYEAFRNELAPIAGLTPKRLTDNFVIAYGRDPGDFFADQSVLQQNFANLARAAKDAGLKGIALDTESYFDPHFWDWQSGRAPCPRSLAECSAQYRLRGKEIMDAIRSTWPEAIVITLHGPYVSDERTADNWNAANINWNNIAWANELVGPFLAGFVESAAGTTAKFIDGGEIYTLRSAADFERSYQWRRNEMVQGSTFIPASFAADWKTSIDLGFGLYDTPDLTGVPMNANIWRSTVTNALERADTYAWAYSESFDWWGVGWPDTPVPNEWLEATRDAREAAGLPR